MFERTDTEWNELDTWEETLETVANISHQVPNDGTWHCAGHFASVIEARLWMESPGWLSTIVRGIHYSPTSDKPYWLMVSRNAHKESSAALQNPAEHYGENAVALCEMMGPIIEENGYKIVTKYPKSWYQSAKLIFDRAEELGKTPESVFALAQWALKDEFWLQNIRSTGKLYKHYDRLREQANKAYANSPATMQTHWERTRAKTEDVWAQAEASQHEHN